MLATTIAAPTLAETAQAYHAMPHQPDHPLVVMAYRALSRVIQRQYWEIRQSFIVEHVADDPYRTSRELFADLDRGRLRVLLTDTDEMPSDHPMLATFKVGTFNAKPVLLNDAFRAVHDVYGHYRTGQGFGPSGELAPWQAHRDTMPSAAWPALWCETRGQNAWTNAHADHADRPLSERPFAAQKAGIVSARFWAA